MSAKRYNYPRFKADDRCRFCLHTSTDHMDVHNFGEEIMTATWDKCTRAVLVPHFQTAICDCPGFSPKDNLKHLEYQYERNV